MGCCGHAGLFAHLRAVRGTHLRLLVRDRWRRAWRAPFGIASRCGRQAQRLYSSVAERQSCKLKVLGSIPSGACVILPRSRCCWWHVCILDRAFGCVPSFLGSGGPCCHSEHARSARASSHNDGRALMPSTCSRRYTSALRFGPVARRPTRILRLNGSPGRVPAGTQLMCALPHGCLV